jgi:threonine/homoserine/homoserine lactone efflux protein
MAPPPDPVDSFDRWFPRLQRALTIGLGSSIIMYAMVFNRIAYIGAGAPLLMWQGYQELRRAGIEKDRAAEEARKAELIDGEW